MFINKVLIFGNITRDLELRSMQNNGSVVNMSIATNRTWKNKEGEKQEAADFHDVVVFGKQAELVSKYLSKGSSIFIEGRLQTRNWEQDGVKRYKTEIVAENIQFGPRKSSDSNQGGNYNNSTTPKTPEINPEDIPF